MSISIKAIISLSYAHLGLSFRLQAQSRGQRAHLHITISPEPGRVQLTDCGDNGQSSSECQPCTNCQALGWVPRCASASNSAPGFKDSPDLEPG